MRAKGIDDNAISVIEPILTMSGSTNDKLSLMKPILASSSIGTMGLEELAQVFNLIERVGISQEVELDLSLARGLNYYTGAIFEVKAKETEMGSICGGGRYDDLTGIFGLPNMPGVGISFGADRIYDVLLSLNKFPSQAVEGTKVLFTNLGENEVNYSLPLLKELRESGIVAEIYTDFAKLKKQFDYADKRAIPFMVIIGEEEINKGCVNLKNILTGEQQTLSKSQLLDYLVSAL